VRSLGPAVKSSVAATGDDSKPFVRTTGADGILESAARYCPRTTDSHH
jgi:hypothetical protein